MGLNIDYIDGQTPLEEEEKEGLLIKSISTRYELDEFEQQNIEKAIEWSLRRKFKRDYFFSEKFVKDLHQQMFKDVWKWAGEFRRTEKNIGTESYKIGVELRYLLEDCLYWIDNKVFEEEEIAIRFKHRIVKIHCFSNGNGRHSRLIADLMMTHIFKKSIFTWNRNSLNQQSNSRTEYLKAVKEADKGDLQSLLIFAKS